MGRSEALRAGARDQRNELVLHFQRSSTYHGGNYRGVEASCVGSTRSGIVSPMEFISEAETSGLIRKLTLWVLRERSCIERVAGDGFRPPWRDLSPVDIHDAVFRRFSRTR